MTRKPRKQAQVATPETKAKESTLKNREQQEASTKSDRFALAGRGQGAYEPRLADRTLVQLAVAAGMTHEKIAAVLDISTKTLTRHFPKELENGAEKANMLVVSNLFRIATQSQDRKAALPAAIWWTKARMGWRGDNGPAVEGGLDVPAGGGQVRFTLKIGDRGDAS